MSDAYEVYHKLLDGLVNQEFSKTVSRLTRHKLSIEERDILITMLAYSYCNNKKTAVTNAERYTGHTRPDIHAIRMICVAIKDLDKTEFNALFNLASARVRECHQWKWVGLNIKALASGETKRFTREVINQIDATQPLLQEVKRIMPDYMITCETCGKSKPISEYKSGYASCKTCREQFKDSKKSAIKNRALKSVVLDSAKSINNRIK